MTAQEVYAETVRFLDTKEQARLAALILDAMEKTDLPLERPDQFFTEDQISRLKELMHRSQNNSLTNVEQAERNTLVEEELLASSQRIAALADALGK